MNIKLARVTSLHIIMTYVNDDAPPQSQPRTQALSSTLLAGENTLAGAGHVTHRKLIAYQGMGKSLVSYYMFPLAHFTLRLQGVAA